MHQTVANHYPWDEAAQSERVIANYDSSKVIRLQGVDIGLFKVVYTADGVTLSQIQVLPTYRGRGIASHLIRQLQEDCAKLALPITLQVLHSNPAVALYSRPGFAILNKDQHSYTMRWEPKSPQ
jgi:ribosomal protein S18 acetylase RimI-like enzyme